MPSKLPPTTEIAQRRQFGELLNNRNLLGTAVEVGTHLGEFAEQFMDGWRGNKLFCVDPWADVDGYQDIIRGRDREADMRAAIARLSKYGQRVELLRGLSAETVTDFADCSLDFVYIDANHAPPYVEQDMNIWWHKIRPGGILAGHDLDEIEFGDGITRVVEAFVDQFGLAAYQVTGDNIASWFILK